jgi:hypothetical protein
MLLLGLAAIQSRVLETELVGLAVWDGGDGDGPGGTAEVVRAWRARGLRVEVISPSGLATERDADIAVRSNALRG